VRGDVGGRYFCDVPLYRLVTGKIREVGFLRVYVPLAREHALAIERFESATQASNSGEQIDERECRFPGRRQA